MILSEAASLVVDRVGLEVVCILRLMIRCLVVRVRVKVGLVELLLVRDMILLDLVMDLLEVVVEDPLIRLEGLEAMISSRWIVIGRDCTSMTYEGNGALGLAFGYEVNISPL